MNEQQQSAVVAVEVQVPCSVRGCGRQVAESQAQVPAIPVMTMGGVALSDLKVREHVYCGRCAYTGRRFGQKFFSLRGTEMELDRRLEERKAEAERRNAIRDAVVKGCRSCNKPVAYKDTRLVPGQPGRYCSHCGAIRIADQDRKRPKPALVEATAPAEVAVKAAAQAA